MISSQHKEKSDWFKIKNLFIILILLSIGAIGVTEGYFRIFSPEPIFENHTTSAFGIETAFRPNLRVQHLFGQFPFIIKTDARHLRNFLKVSYKKPKNTFRILCVGGSIFAASGVNNTETFAYYLQKTLEKQFPEHNFEVINAAKNSWEIAEFYTFIKNEGYKYNPDLVVAYFHTGELSTMDFSKLEADIINFERLSANEVEIEIRGISFNQHLNKSSASLLNFFQLFPFYDSLFNNFHFWRTLEKEIRENLVDKKSSKNKLAKISVEQSMNNWQLKSTDSIHWKTEFGEIKSTQVGQIEAILYSIGLSKFYSLLNSINSKLAFLIVPSPQETLKMRIYPTNLIPKKINAQQTFTIINLSKQLTNFQEKSLIPLNFPNIIHWTPAGHHIASKLTFNSMIEANIIPGTKDAQKSMLSLENNQSFKSIEESNKRISVQLKKLGHDSFTRGAIYLSQNKFGKAEESLKRFININPNNSEALWSLANLYFKKNKYKTSLDFIEKAISNNYPLTDAVYGLKAMNYFKLNRFDKAEFLFSKAISLSPMNALLHFNFGNFLLLRNRFEEAISELEKANHLFPNNIKTILTIGTAYFVSGEKIKAIKFFEKALAIDSQDPMIQKTFQNLNIKIQRKNIQ